MRESQLCEAVATQACARWSPMLAVWWAPSSTCLLENSPKLCILFESVLKTGLETSRPHKGQHRSLCTPTHLSSRAAELLRSFGVSWAGLW